MLIFMACTTNPPHLCRTYRSKRSLLRRLLLLLTTVAKKTVTVVLLVTTVTVTIRVVARVRSFVALARTPAACCAI